MSVFDAGWPADDATARITGIKKSLYLFVVMCVVISEAELTLYTTSLVALALVVLFAAAAAAF